MILLTIGLTIYSGLLVGNGHVTFKLINERVALPFLVQYSVINSTAKQERIRVHIYNMMDGFFNPNPFYGCDDRCYLTSGTDNYASSSIVLFLAPRISPNAPKKYPGQNWIFFGQESPFHHSAGSFRNWNNLFNWTMTQRRDSDIIMGYGSYGRRKHPHAHLPEIVINKTNTKFLDPVKAAWMVSKCRTSSQREKYVQKLQEVKNIQIDIYGGCGKHKCSKSSNTVCLNIISKSYPFYLSFENSICVDYVTEKVYKLLDNNMNSIPLVRGDSDSYSHLLPFGSYINVNYYKSREELVKDMENILKNNSRFQNFFSWRKYYQKLDEKPFCTLCNFLHQKNKTKFNRIYDNMDLWLRGNNERLICSQPKDI